MIGFKVGERVTVTIKGRVTEVDDCLMLIEYASRGDLKAEAPIVPDAEAVTIERVAPAEWPPQHQDVWADRDGDHWYGVLVDNDTESDGPYVELWCSRSSKNRGFNSDLDHLIQRHGPFALVHREETADPLAHLLIDPDCRDGKHASCVGDPCECPCHSEAGESA